MRIKSLPFLVIFLLLSSLTMPAIACPNPYCGSCCYWVSTGPGPSDGYCELNAGAECGDCSGCYNPCYSCSSCFCEWDCSTGETCCNGSCCGNCCIDSGTYCCQSTETCCQGSCCGSTQCCNDGTCVTTCPGCKTCSSSGVCEDDDEECVTCKECDNGNCVLKPTSECATDSDCDPSQHCENCKCVCDSCWVKKWKDPVTQECYCDDGCPGYYKHKDGYYTCAAAGVGEGGQCECVSVQMVKGVRYECDINWDITNMINCANEAALCSIPCLIAWEPASCSECLMAAQAECCDSGICELCDFIEECEEDTGTGVLLYGWEFVSLEGGSCEG